jgi:basic membrane lipoprotein Med (substrate-binding protein (PBP1-ABC) superfamily)
VPLKPSVAVVDTQHMGAALRSVGVPEVSASRRAWRWTAAGAAAFAAVLAAGCDSGPDASRSGRPLSSRPPLVVGFLYVGSVHDHGYNEAAYRGSLAIKRAFPRARLLQAQHVPESSAAEPVMQRMIDQGATIIFPTSFGHLEPALRVAGRNPRVTFLHQGGLQIAANLGTYFGTIWQAEYAVGQAAGLATRSNRLGFVAAFPIAQSLLTINAFELGARSVNPRARTRVIFTSSWCEPRKQQRVARRLLAWGADVLTQHQDCTAAVIHTAAAAGAKTAGYHDDARALAPKAWLTAAVWNWGPLYVDMVRTVAAGRFASSPYAARYRAGIKDGTVAIASFGGAATPRIRRTVLATYRKLRSGGLEPFRGPVRDQRGRLRIPARQPSITELEETDYLVQGVVGTTSAQK